jgi:O-antigen ligase
MELSLSNLFTKEKFNRALLFLFVVSIFFSVRYVFPTPGAHILGDYSDFTSFSLYISDILALGLILFNLKSIIRQISVHKIVIIPLFISILALLLHIFDLSTFNLFFFVKSIEFWLIYVLFSTYKLYFNFISLLIGLSSLQAIIALAQFSLQQSLGLYLIGESPLNPVIPNVAKLVSYGTTLIRGYGTFPHANILGVFMIGGAISCLTTLFHVETKKYRIILAALLLINILGLFISFSRAALLGLLMASVLVFALYIYKFALNKRVFSILAIFTLSCLVSIAILRPFLFSRATLLDAAVSERSLYNKIGLNIIKSYPITGIGGGEIMLHMERFSPLPLVFWQVQPIHNYYLQATAELGLILAILLIIFFFWHIVRLGQIIIKYRGGHQDSLLLRIALFSLLGTFLLLMLFDHYFYTLQQPQLLLWLILGLTAGQILQYKKQNPA